jgi:putative membrane protein
MSDNDNNGGGLKGAVDKAQDMIGGVVGMASAATAGSHDSEAFVANAGIGDLYEIEAGEMAMLRSRSDGVRDFAQMMVEHHTTSMHQMQSALASSEVRSDLPSLQAPMDLDERRRGMIDNLRDAPDDAFDGRYMDQQRSAHQETATLLKGYLEHGDNPQLRSVARGALPMVERHLKALGHVARH